MRPSVRAPGHRTDARDRPGVAARLCEPVDDLTRAFAKIYLRAWQYHLLVIVALSSAATLWVPLAAVLPSFCLTAGSLLALGAACRRFLKQGDNAISLHTWRGGFVLGELTHGIGCILFALPLFSEAVKTQYAASANSFMLVAVLLAMVASALLRAPIPSAVLAGMMPLSIVIVLMALHATGPGETALALITLSAQFVFAYLSMRLHRHAEATFHARAEMQASIAELDRAKANSVESRRRAEEAERVKSQFLATMSHELRTPLNAILGFSELMKNEVLGSHSTASYREYSSDIHGSGQHLLSLINEILDLSRIEAGDYELGETTAYLGDLVRESIVAMRGEAEAKQHTISVVIEPHLEPVWVGTRAVRQMIGSLLSNAIKFTAPGGQIVVKAGWTSLGGQYVSVTDNGPGIPENEIPVVMSSFGRGSLAVSSAERGAGLGFPIVKGLAALHGGRFILRASLDAGTVAAVTFPASRILSEDGSTSTGRDPASSAAAA